MKNNEQCVEMNEIFYRISTEFWKQAYNSLLKKQKEYEPDPDISREEAIFEFQNGLKKMAKDKKLKCNGFSHNDHFFMSLTPYPIYIGIEKTTGDFTISAPHINTKHFDHSQYLCGIKWIEDFLEIDIKPLSEKMQVVHDKFLLNEKTSEIARTSIEALCKTLLGERGIKYILHQRRLSSDIVFCLNKNEAYEICIFLKPFSENPTELISLLKNPHEMIIEDMIVCSRIEEEIAEKGGTLCLYELTQNCF